jgi:hypothetical protein
MKNSTYNLWVPDRVDGEEVTRDDPGGLLTQKRRQVVATRRGAGSSRWRRSVVRIVVAEIWMPRRSSSPAWVLPGQADDQLLAVLIELRSA